MNVSRLVVSMPTQVYMPDSGLFLDPVLVKSVPFFYQSVFRPLETVWLVVTA